ncbi:ABC transporter permease subunit [bacterium]|nr:ABC transporter permease subunit [bacterium]
MIGIVFMREMQEYLKSAKFMLGLVLCLGLITLSTAINFQDYRERLADYEMAVEETKAGPPYGMTGIRRPEPLGVIVQGKDRSLGNRISIKSHDLPWNASGYMGAKSMLNAVASGLESVDLDFIVRVVLSLLAIFLTYDSVSGEKTRGTLRLMLAGGLPRSSLLAGKLAAVFTLLSISLLCCFIVALLVLTRGGIIAVGMEEIQRLAAMYLLSICYLAVFIVLGVLVSTVTATPAASLALVLQAWVFIVIIYPNLSLHLAERLDPLPSAQSFRADLAAAGSSYSSEQTLLNQEREKAEVQNRPISRELMQQSNMISAKVALALYQAGQGYNARLARQARLADRLCMFCPAVLYSGMMRDLAGTGIEQYRKFLEPERSYWEKTAEKSRLLFGNDRQAYRNYKLPEYSYPKDRLGPILVRSTASFLTLIGLTAAAMVTSFAAMNRMDAR